MEPSFAVSSAVIGAPPQVSTSAPMQHAGNGESDGSQIDDKAIVMAVSGQLNSASSAAARNFPEYRSTSTLPLPESSTSNTSGAMMPYRPCPWHFAVSMHTGT